MFKGIVTKLAKEAWDNAGKPPAPRPQPPAEPQPVQRVAEVEAVAEPEIETDIEFPYYPGEGTACGDACRCKWHVEIRWSDEYQSNATFATWQTTGDGDVCPDCQRRAEEWQDVMVRIEPS